MKTLLRITFVLAVTLSVSVGAQAQSGYTTGIGLRGGVASGLTIKHFIKSDAAIEGIISTNFRHRGAVITVLYEKHAQAFNARGLQWYYGIGGHVGFHDGRHYYDRDHKHYYDDRVVALGIDGVLGLEYYIRDIPFTIGADIKPYINIPSGGGFWDSALHVRYVF
ncbi:hypothetical protein [Pontibacter cellulosilyticus]|uniref:DUF3575 domain-containing protein n=1 Tax=Pontibacter cellulosilyticus TaxID=1720253 RepID=A0A923N8F4_9BACT|nr:hypothetical protein [Pontibacter cellulosilyticus]MBC5993659.1 hypothetical protein [Pontibacter cellulosilyticus]